MVVKQENERIGTVRPTNMSLSVRQSMLFFNCKLYKTIHDDYIQNFCKNIMTMQVYKTRLQNNSYVVF